jgi:endonuclease I
LEKLLVKTFACFRALILTFAAWVLFASSSNLLADAYDPPANFYAAATGTGATLKSQLNVIAKTGHTLMSYNAARTSLQAADADPNNPGYMISAYDRVLINVAAINPGGPIPGWDNGITWNREHTWPQSRGLSGTGAPDGSDLFGLRGSFSSTNGSRGNLNYGGAFGQSWGVVSDAGQTYFYPGDADAGMIARQAFYMATRYDGTDSNTTDLELVAGNPASGGSLMGNLTRLLEWNYLVTPDLYERHRNQVIYTDFQHNRNPYTDHPEFVWSVFVDQQNDSQITIAGGTATGDGGTARDVNLGSVLVGAILPAAQSYTLNKSGLDGTYYEVMTAGDATSSVSGRFNAFAMNAAGSKSVNVGLASSTSSAGLKSGTVTIDNLDITTQAGAGKGANDANDLFNVSLNVLDHANASFAGGSDLNSLTLDFGAFALGSGTQFLPFDVFNLMATAGFTAPLDLLSFVGSGDTSVLDADLSLVNDLAAGTAQGFSASLDTTNVGSFAASYQLSFSDDTALAGAVGGQHLTLNLLGRVEAVPEPTAWFMAVVALMSIAERRTRHRI